MAERILVVEDDDATLQLVQFNLRRAGYTVYAATSGEEALSLLASDTPDLVILDVELPGMDGFSVCRDLRRRQQVPVMILSARVEEIDRVVGFELGADDYVTKPFSPRELVGRVRAILRRAQPRAQEGRPSIKYGPVHLDPESYEVTVGGQRANLTPTEYRILKTFVLHPRRVFGREELAPHLIGDGQQGRLRVVDVHIRHLRRKLDQAAGTRLGLIDTVRGAGYRFTGSTGE